LRAALFLLRPFASSRLIIRFRHKPSEFVMVKPKQWIFALAAILLSTNIAFAAPANLPPNQALVDIQLADFAVAGTAAGDGDSHIVNVTDAPGFAQAMRIETRKREANEYDLQDVLKLPWVALHNGDVIWASVWARMVRTEDESGQGILGLVLEQTQEPFNKLIQRRVSVGPAWQELAVPVRVRGEQAAGSLHLVLRVGGAAQTLEIGGMQLIRFNHPSAVDLNQLPQTRITYGGREPDAAWRAAAEERIDQIRKAPLTVRVVDGAGHPIAGAHVIVEMRQHAFPFGCVYSPRLIPGADAKTPADPEYARRFAELFNVGVDEAAMKWPGWETPATRDIAIKALDWMDAHGVRVRGHCLVWPGWRHLPADVATMKDDPAALGKRVNDHIRDEVAALRGRVTEWDVINEPYANNDLMKTLGYGVMADWFKTARDADPSHAADAE
jgi:endo-1,4-beta-xylanase